MPQSDWSRGKSFFSTTPVTKVILALMAVGFLASIIAAGSLEALLRLLAYIPFFFPNMLTGIFTHPFVFYGAGSILHLLITGWIFWMFGGSLERSWGPRMFTIFLAGASAASVLVWTVGAVLFGANAIIGGPWLLLSAVIVAWAWLNPEETILFMFVLPMKAKWLGWLDIALLFFMFPLGQGVNGAKLFVLGFFALGGVAVAYAFARYHRDWAWVLRPQNRSKPNRRVLRHPSSTFVGAMTRPWREWQRRRRIAYLQKTLHIEEEDAGQAKG
ncbi:MAG: rhomboid family intramembrane serine protease [Armatimonadota bacterium]